MAPPGSWAAADPALREATGLPPVVVVGYGGPASTHTGHFYPIHAYAYAYVSIMLRTEALIRGRNAYIHVAELDLMQPKSAEAL